MKKIAIIALMLTLTVGIQAQTGKGKGKNGPKMGQMDREKIAQELGLSDEQKEKLKAIEAENPQNFENRKEKLKEVLTPEQLAKMEQIHNLRKEMNLSPEQRQKMKEMMKVDREKIKASRKEFRESLTEEQKQKLKALKNGGNKMESSKVVAPIDAPASF